MTTRWNTGNRLTFDVSAGVRQAAALAEAGDDGPPGPPAAPGEMLVIADRRTGVLERLTRNGWTTAARVGNVIRLTHPAAAVPEVERTCADLRAAGVAADPNRLLVAAGGYIKFTGAMAEPTDLRPPNRCSAGHIKFTRAAALPTGHRPPSRLSTGDGAGVRVAVLDTGIDPRAVRADHDRLAGITVGADNREGPGSGGLLGRATGHGTFCAGIVRQVAPACDLRAVRVLDDDGLGTDFAVARAIFALAASEDPPHIVNLSMSVAGDRPPIAVTAALAALRAAHPPVRVVAAAGNDGRTAPAWPAADPAVLAVGSPAAYSNHGAWVDVVVPAEGVVSTAVEGVRAGPGGFAEHRRAYAAWTGTSFAAPQVAGLLAVRLSRDLQPVC